MGGVESEITLCDIHSGSSTHILRSHTLPVMSLTWSPLNDFTLASGSQDNRVLLWDIRKATGPLMSLDQHNGGGGANTTGTPSGTFLYEDPLPVVLSNFNDPLPHTLTASFLL